MDKYWAEKLKGFEAVWKRVCAEKEGDRPQPQKLMPGKRRCSTNTRFHGGGGRR